LTADIKKSSTNNSLIVDLFVKSLKNNLDDKLTMYANMLEYLILSRYDWDSLVNHYKRAIVVLPSSDSFKLRNAVVERVFLTFGIEKTRSLYKWYFNKSHHKSNLNEAL
jgi:hypothetical protein